MTASARTGVFAGGLLALAVALTQVASGQPDPSTVLAATTNAAKTGGRVLKDPGCGCPSARPKWDDAEAAHYPTRCLAGNEVNPGTAYLPINDAGVVYPTFNYPPGFPYTYTYPSHSWLTGSFTAGSVIPFPGWPAVKGNRTSTWSSGGRPAYVDAYVNKMKATPPGKLRPDAVNKDSGWEEWQIHHILERKHNANDEYGNLVPAYSYPRSWALREDDPVVAASRSNLNEHSRYTQYWQKIRVDSEFKNATDVKLWDELNKCEVVIWP